jgi:hypothetical protein
MEKKVIFLLILLSLRTAGQQELLINNSSGIFAGITLNAGTHVLRFGIRMLAFTSIRAFEIKAEQRFYVNLMTWGPPVSSLESVTSFGTHWGVGEKDKKTDIRLYSLIQQNSTLKHSIGYFFNIYQITNKTSQKTGMICINSNKFSFFMENDILAKKILDRFRTGAFGMMFQANEYIQVFIKNILWTGKYGKRQSYTHPHFRLKCYMDTTGSEHIRYSAGILSVGVNFFMKNQYYYTISGGWDSEKIRDFVQNKLIHDMIFLPSSWLKKSANCHLPMIDENGNIYLFKDYQKIRKSKPYLNLGLNEATFY